jgi:hypothetical protein
MNFFFIVLKLLIYAWHLVLVEQIIQNDDLRPLFVFVRFYRIFSNLKIFNYYLLLSSSSVLTKIRRSVRTYRTCPNFGILRYLWPKNCLDFYFFTTNYILKNLSTGTPATVDFLHKFNGDFKSHVTDHLDKLSRDALLSQDDPARMRDCIAQRIRKAILNRVYGKRKYITNLCTVGAKTLGRLSKFRRFCN